MVRILDRGCTPSNRIRIGAMLHRISVISRHKAPVPLYKESSSDGTLNDIDGVEHSGQSEAFNLADTTAVA